jgi:hypothetical protein
MLECAVVKVWAPSVRLKVWAHIPAKGLLATGTLGNVSLYLVVH